MRIEVRLYAILRKYSELSSNGIITLDVPEHYKVRHVIAMLHINIDEIKLIMINGKHAELDTALSDSDRVGLFPPVGGG